MGKRFIVCGGRNWKDRMAVYDVLDRLHAKVVIDEIAQGGANGVDRLARQWATDRGVACREYRADWDRYGPRAGPLRNAEMAVDFQPDGVVAFPGGVGTLSMISIAEYEGIQVWEPLGSAWQAEVKAPTSVNRRLG